MMGLGVWPAVLWQLAVGTLVVFYWRGTWVLADVYFYPDDPEASAWTSVAIGYGGMLVLAVHQLCSSMVPAPTAASGAEQASEIGGGGGGGSAALRWLHGYLVAFLVVNCWRGIWFLLDLHVLVDDSEASAWVTHLIGAVLLTAAGHFQSVLAPPAIKISDNGPEALRPGRLFTEFAVSTDVVVCRTVRTDILVCRTPPSPADWFGGDGSQPDLVVPAMQQREIRTLSLC